MRYYLTTDEGAIRDEYGQIIIFNSKIDARHWAINHLDLSVDGLEIQNAGE